MIWLGPPSLHFGLALVGDPCLPFSSRVVTTCSVLFALGGLMHYRDHPTRPPPVHTSLCVLLRVLRNSPSPYQSLFPFKTTGDPGKVLRVLEQNSHHSQRSFASLLATNKMCYLLFTAGRFPPKVSVGITHTFVSPSMPIAFVGIPSFGRGVLVRDWRQVTVPFRTVSGFSGGSQQWVSPPCTNMPAVGKRQATLRGLLCSFWFLFCFVF